MDRGNKHLKKLLWYLIAATRGGHTRARILNYLIDRPYNANQLAGYMRKDYKTIRHHLNVLVKNGLITVDGEKYGSMYFISEIMKSNLDDFKQIWERVEENDKDKSDKSIKIVAS